jgi:hypothetical protein
VTKVPSEKGTLIRGADGGLYYLTDDQLQAFRLPDDAAKEVGNSVEHSTAAKKLAAVHGEDLLIVGEGHRVAMPGHRIEMGEVGGHRVNLEKLRAPTARKSA